MISTDERGVVHGIFIDGTVDPGRPASSGFTGMRWIMANGSERKFRRAIRLPGRRADRATSHWGKDSWPQSNPGTVLRSSCKTRRASGR